MLRVVHVVPARFGPDGVVGGAERYAFELARHMAKQTKTTLVAFAETSGHDQVGDLTIRTVRPQWHAAGQRTNPWSFRVIPELLNGDVVHCHQQHIVASSLSALFCRFSGRKVFVSDLGGGGWDISSYISTDYLYNGHLHISNYSRRVYGHVGRPWAKVIYGGVDTEKFSPDPSISKTDTAVFAGRILPHKGVDYLVRAIPKGIRLELIGRPYSQRFLCDLQRLAEDKAVDFRHDCDDDELIKSYRRALCVVLPSVYRNCYGEETKVPELLGQTLLEGMACGTPVIATNVASIPEIVLDGVTGFVVPPNDSSALRERLEWLRDHPKEAATIGAAARRRILEEFVWPKVVSRCLDIYSGLK